MCTQRRKQGSRRERGGETLRRPEASHTESHWAGELSSGQ